MLPCRGPATLAPGVMTTGEVPRVESFETVEGFWTMKNDQYTPDSMPDDQSLAIHLPGKGLVVISGCAHSGIINTIRYAQRITGEERLYAVIGGFHLMGADNKRIDATARTLLDLDPAVVRAGSLHRSESPLPAAGYTGGELPASDSGRFNQVLRIMEMERLIAFGPVPSRRLGRSLGINNIPAKICSYSCAYCQVGRTLQMSADRRPYYPPQQIFDQVAQKVAEARDLGLTIDYLSFVPDGEPTLDSNLGEEIERLRSLGIKIAVISNASLIWDERVREDLFKADWVSVKVDSLDEKAWRRIDRPHRSLRLDMILQGIEDFTQEYSGILATESMLLAGINDCKASLLAIGEFLEKIDPEVSYISVPIRPPTESWVQMPSPESLCLAYQIFSQRLKRVELLVGYEGDCFDFTGEAKEDILAIASVHPMREVALRRFLEKSGNSWDIIEELLEKKELIRIEYQGNSFYLRRPEKQDKTGTE